ncbi:methyl-CpG-binding domain protein 3 isoform X2 [Pogonomyrmex barbatus]|uniref:Methyl-CpG-binding domain protein 3 isoform X2 n=1 Tax=Pogonomyrmex barbatus TaxID=144034 RepID=A0A6I9XLF2_9HYME|nr:methyl-CpG-binding domain protein 3 isoform X2 [Pogonomyrmex barbatus]
MNMSVEKKKYPSALPLNWPAREEPPRKTQNQLATTGKVDYYYNRSVRNDASLVPPIRQTASIFKQPVTIYKMQEGKVKDIKHSGTQEKPKQLFWEKRLEGLRACDPDGYEFDAMDLPKNLKPVGPYITEETLLQSVATALHVSTQPVTGQTGSKTALEKNPGVFLNPDQPLVQAVAIADEDIRRQEDRVVIARKKLQDALRNLQT